MSTPKGYREKWNVCLDEVRDLHSTTLEGGEREERKNGGAQVLAMYPEGKMGKRMKRWICGRCFRVLKCLHKKSGLFLMKTRGIMQFVFPFACSTCPVRRTNGFALPKKKNMAGAIPSAL